MDQMYVYHIKLVFVEFEGELTASLVSHYASHAGCYRALLLVFQMLGMLGFDKTDQEHFPQPYLPNWEKVKLCEMIGKIEDDGLSLGHLSLLPTYHYEIVLPRVLKYLVHSEYLLLSVHIEGHSEDSEALARKLLSLLNNSQSRILLELGCLHYHGINAGYIVDYLKELNYFVYR